MPRHLTAESLGLDVVLGLALGLGLGNCKFLTRMITMSAGDGGERSSGRAREAGPPKEEEGWVSKEGGREAGPPRGNTQPERA